MTKEALALSSNVRNFYNVVCELEKATDDKIDFLIGLCGFYLHEIEVLSQRSLNEVSAEIRRLLKKAKEVYVNFIKRATETVNKEAKPGKKKKELFSRVMLSIEEEKRIRDLLEDFGDYALELRGDKEPVNITMFQIIEIVSEVVVEILSIVKGDLLRISDSDVRRETRKVIELMEKARREHSA